MRTMVDRVCTNKGCRVHFKAVLADVQRGWGKFCSKRCKAVRQARLTGVRGPTRIRREYDHYDMSWDAHEVPR